MFQDLKKSRAGFVRGSAVYKCGCCKRATRATGRGDNENSRLCAECYDLGGETNSLSDNGELYDAGAAKSAMAALTAKGVAAADLFPEVAQALAEFAQAQADEAARMAAETRAENAWLTHSENSGFYDDPRGE